MLQRISGTRWAPARHATAPRPFFATSANSFSETPRGRFSLRSHRLTRPVVALRQRANSRPCARLLDACLHEARGNDLINAVVLPGVFECQYIGVDYEGVALNDFDSYLL